MDFNNYSRQFNPNNVAYWKSRGLEDRPTEWNDIEKKPVPSQKDLDNRAKQLNPNNSLYHKSRGASNGGEQSHQAAGDTDSTWGAGTWLAVGIGALGAGLLAAAAVSNNRNRNGTGNN